MSSFFMRFPNGKAKAMTFSYDDGVIFDKRLAEIFIKNNLRATFNLNSALLDGQGRHLSKEAATELYSDPHFEVAIHGLTHPFLEQLSAARIAYEVVQDRENLEKMFGTIVRGMAYPYGTYNSTVLEVLKNTDIAYSRTVPSSGTFALPKNWLELSATCHHNDPRLMELADKFISDEPKREAYLFYVWGHSFEFDGNNNWEVIENFASKIADKEDVWYATNIEIYDYIQAFSHLEFSCDGKIVKNPTAYDLYYVIDNAPCCVKAGETVKY